MGLLDRAMGRNTDQPSMDAVRAARPDALPLDRAAPETTEIATFAMGCFWGPDARFGARPGVVRTRSGYCGGDSAAPSYHDLDGHTETVQVEYDPEALDYGQLLDWFVAWHDLTADRSRQYRSIVFVHDADQRAQAEAALADRDGAATVIQDFERFWPAEHYHQKYRLRGHGSVLAALADRYGPVELLNSTVAARLNGFLAGYGTADQLARERDRYGLDDDALALVAEAVGTADAGAHC